MSLEFAFAMIVMMALIYGTVMVFRWTGVSLLGREQHHEAILTQSVPDDFTDPAPPFLRGSVTPLNQVSDVFYRPPRGSFNFVLPDRVIWGN